MPLDPFYAPEDQVYSLPEHLCTFEAPLYALEEHLKSLFSVGNSSEEWRCTLLKPGNAHLVVIATFWRSGIWLHGCGNFEAIGSITPQFTRPTREIPRSEFP